MIWLLFLVSFQGFAMDCSLPLEGSKLFLIVGPSGVGKTTLVRSILNTYREPLHFVVGVTTREPRPGEVDGVDYYFWSEAAYEEAWREDRFVTTFRGPRARYGDLSSEFDPFLRDGVPVLCVVDLDGARKIKAKYPGSQIVLLVTSRETVARRLAERNTESETERRERYTADRAYAESPGEVDVTLVNDDVKKTAEELIRRIRMSFGPS